MRIKEELTYESRYEYHQGFDELQKKISGDIWLLDRQLLFIRELSNLSSNLYYILKKR